MGKTNISTVHYSYIGTDEQFNKFLKTIIKDYITEDSMLPDKVCEDNVTDKKSA